MKINCASCHSAEGWKISAEYWQNYDPVKPRVSRTTGMPLPADTLRFHHGKTQFALKGRHATVDCRACHETLVFSQAKSDCNSCHQDIHQQTLGTDCARCHSSDNWIVDNITSLHQENGFPLTGVHTALSCDQCHSSASTLQFNRIGNDCISCHQADFNGSKNPNHKDAGFGTECLECHDLFNPDWHTDKVNHDFFPLTKGHEIADCAKCHVGGDYANTPNNCIACHQPDYQGAVNPNHVQANFSNACQQCHTTDPDWMPAQYTQHDADYFPIYSGKHQGQWTQCTDCHTNASNYAEYSCTVCHLNPETNNGHSNVNGYVYENTACLACHPTGDAGVAFDHNATAFPLTGAHLSAACVDCHAAGYVGTPTQCAACHTTDFNQAANPNHVALNIPTDCAQCHTTAPGWEPASFPIHNNYYALNGAHAAIANDCATCHNGNYNSTPNTCTGCHASDYAATTNPNHAASQFPTNCALCHTESAWAPSTFDHNAIYPFTGAHVAIAQDCNACHHGNFTNTPNTCAGCHTADFNQTTNPKHPALNIPTDCAMCHTTAPGWEPASFPIHNNYYTLNGAHAAIANNCATCHNGNYNSTPNTCNGCHAPDYAATTNPNHAAQQFPTDCASCHTENAWTPTTFDHNAIYPFTGAHTAIAQDCNACHHGNYSNTPNTCAGCHTPDFNSSTNPNHVALNIPTDCAMCHTTTPDWEPATFPIHNNYYALNGAHAAIANDCAACHNGNYNNTPTTCIACHTTDYNQTTSPNHVALQFSTNCTTCHSETAWSPSTFDHDAQYFPIYSGKHNGEWTACTDCHTNPSNYAEYTCTTCHANPETNNQHNGVNGYVYSSPACLACHPTGDASNVFDHNATAFPLTGAHLAAGCLDCHAGGFVGTPTQCNACHSTDFNQAANPNHVALNIPTDCAMCHTTAPSWAPAGFPIHNNYYALNGAHASIANDCATCHNGNYNSTPNTCNACHASDFAATTDPNHVAQQFPTDCAACHSESAWAPSTFDHNAHYPFTGAHVAIADDCNACHQGNYSNTPNICAGCHMPDYTASANPNHTALNLPTDCAMCHTTAAGWEPATFPIHSNYYSLNGAHATIANDCAACHNGNYTTIPNTCSGCHTPEYNATTNPNHASAQFPTDCASCHSESVWVPANFNHDGQYFPIYSGDHNGEWTQCIDCHSNPSNYAEVNCTNCHTNPETNNQHNGVNGYSYNSSACLACHPTGSATNIFDHNTTSFPLTGAHLTAQCLDCHASGYAGTPTQCSACHTTDYNQAANPNHLALNIPTDCAQCHTTAPGWQPASFPIHNNFYALNGAHAAIANDCAACHNGNYNSTPNTCNACHASDYNATTIPNHATAQFPTDCALCHSETAWTPSNFNHSTVYPLTGAHATIANDCNLCHVNGNYNNTPNTCAGCHTPDFNASVNPNHVALNIPTDCAMCHNTAPGWEPATFPIHNNYYPLNGAHAAIAHDCATCHNGNYNSTPNTCVACHTAEYNGTTNPNHAAEQLPTDCASCHSETAWAPSTFNHSSVYPLTGAHASIANDCNLCHINGNYSNTPNTCAGCHTPDFNASTNPNHVALNIPTDCAMCHSTAPGWEPATFPIHNNYYALNGAHAAIANDCATCHNGNYNNTPNTCFACHTPEYNGTSNPNHATAQFPTDCALCHSETAWTPSNFDHNTIYPLTGAHATIANDCNLCHINGNFNNTPNTCAGCHTPDFNASTNPNHVSLNIPTDCAMCHTTAPGWEPATFPIHNNYYILNGAHAAIANDCATCHNGNYNNTPNTCAGCHTPEYNATSNPNHAAAQFPMDCATCHTENAWIPATFDHTNIYPLTGAHATIANDCSLCHINGNYSNTPNTCAGCHTPDFNASTNPNHISLNIPTDCAMCHTTAPGWAPATFPIHNSYYALNGAHATIASDCAACHNGNYNNTPNTCSGCHTPEYNATTNPNHAAEQLPLDCASCHSETAWAPSTFNHTTVYPLTGAHLTIANDCNLCHLNGNYTTTPNTCAGCHTPNFNAATNPNHVALNIPTDCAMCHTTDPGWDPATFPIHNSYYALNGAHATIASNCAVCHNGNYNNTPTTCVGCHLPDYNATTNPNHIAAQFPTDCASCHSETAWVPSTFDHNALYPLTGAHASIANSCNLCHINGNYTTTPNTCAGCHTPDYNSSTNPNHVQLSIPTDCAMCHTTDPDWMPATFPIHNNYWALTGAHTSASCADCHNGNYNNTPTTCYACHASEYNTANSPNHVSSQFPTTCQNCHSTTGWTPANWNHDQQYFPIYSGAHENAWNQCVECHTTPGNFATFSCIQCHEHDNPTNMANHHQGVPGYQYNSQACYNCHPNGTH